MKEHRITIRLTEDEFDSITKVAKGLDMKASAYARYAIREFTEVRRKLRIDVADDCSRARHSLKSASAALDSALERMGFGKPH